MKREHESPDISNTTKYPLLYKDLLTVIYDIIEQHGCESVNTIINLYRICKDKAKLLCNMDHMCIIFNKGIQTNRLLFNKTCISTYMDNISKYQQGLVLYNAINTTISGIYVDTNEDDFKYLFMFGNTKILHICDLFPVTHKGKTSRILYASIPLYITIIKQYIINMRSIYGYIVRIGTTIYNTQGDINNISNIDTSHDVYLYTPLQYSNSTFKK